jgi:hypothetical protein
MQTDASPRRRGEQQSWARSNSRAGRLGQRLHWSREPVRASFVCLGERGTQLTGLIDGHKDGHITSKIQQPTSKSTRPAGPKRPAQGIKRYPSGGGAGGRRTRGDPHKNITQFHRHACFLAGLMYRIHEGCFMSALPPKADILGRHEIGLLMTQSGHWRIVPGYVSALSSVG